MVEGRTTAAGVMGMSLLYVLTAFSWYRRSDGHETASWLLAKTVLRQVSRGEVVLGALPIVEERRKSKRNEREGR